MLHLKATEPGTYIYSTIILVHFNKKKCPISALWKKFGVQKVGQSRRSQQLCESSLGNPIYGIECGFKLKSGSSAVLLALWERLPTEQTRQKATNTPEVRGNNCAVGL